MLKHIYLVGFMASGKSTIGPLLAKQKGCAFLDLDTLIEEEQKMTILEIFESKGEAFFRDLESHHLVQTRKLSPSVIALGGGTLVRQSNRDFVGLNGVTVWLQIPLRLAEERIKKVEDRPLARDPQSFQSLFHEREPYYRLSDIQVSAQGKTPSQICTEIQEKLVGRID